MHLNLVVYMMTNRLSVGSVIWVIFLTSSSASKTSSSHSCRPPNNFSPTVITIWRKELHSAINRHRINDRVCFQSSHWFSSQAISSSSISMQVWATSRATTSLVTASRRFRYRALRLRHITPRSRAIISRSIWIRNRWREAPCIIISICLMESACLTQVPTINRPSFNRISFKHPQLHSRCSRYHRNHLTMFLGTSNSSRWYLVQVECSLK